MDELTPPGGSLRENTYLIRFHYFNTEFIIKVSVKTMSERGGEGESRRE